jgi:hypothetical protein
MSVWTCHALLTKLAERGRHTKSRGPTSCVVHDGIAPFPQMCFVFFGGGVRLCPLGTSVTVLPIVAAPDDGWWWVWGGRRNYWQGNRSNRRKPSSVPLRPPQIPHDQTRNRARTAVESSDKPPEHVPKMCYAFPDSNALKNTVQKRLLNIGALF